MAVNTIYDSKERTRCLIVKLIFAAYWLLIFEGTLRKWFFPQHANILYFARDMFVIAAYVLVFINNMWPKKSTMFSSAMLLVVTLGFLSLIQSVTTQINPLVLMFGWRNYAFYIPFAFIIGEHFKAEDLKRLIKHTLLLAIPVAILVYVQVSSPYNSFINRSVAEGVYYSISDKVGTGRRIIRATGTFSFFTGQQLFIGSVVAFLLATWVLDRKRRPLRGTLLYLATIATIVIFSLDLTRLPIFLSGFILLGALFSGFIIRSQKLGFRAKLFPIIIFVLTAVVLLNLFTFAYDIRKRRFQHSDVEWRIPGMFESFLNVFHVPLFGYGLGFNTRGAKALGVDPKNVYEDWNTGGEYEWRFVIIDAGPIFGLLYIIFRIILTAWIFLNAIKAVRRSNNPLPILLACYIGSIILIWYITRNGTVNGYGWLFAGFCIAANQLGKDASIDNKKTQQ